MGQFGERNGIHASEFCLNECLLVQLDAELIELLAQNLSRLDEESEVDRAGVYYVLSELSRTKYTTGILITLKTSWKTLLRKQLSQRR